MNKDIFVDFDGTICPNHNGDSYPPPSPECLEVLRELKRAGNRIVIYSVRSNKSESGKIDGDVKMQEYLILHDVPFDSINASKPHFRMVIDDKGLGVPLDGNKNVDWVKVNDLLKQRGYIDAKPDLKKIASSLADFCDGGDYGGGDYE
jgi:hypothetical protein